MARRRWRIWRAKLVGVNGGALEQGREEEQSSAALLLILAHAGRGGKPRARCRRRESSLCLAPRPPWACTRTLLPRRARPLLPYHRLHLGVWMLCAVVAHTRRHGQASAVHQLRRHHIATVRRLCCRHTLCPRLNHVHVDDHVRF